MSRDEVDELALKLRELNINLPKDAHLRIGVENLTQLAREFGIPTEGIKEFTIYNWGTKFTFYRKIS